MDLSRRDLLASLLQALFLALFPWLRTERGGEVLRAAVEGMVSVDIDTTMPGGEFANYGLWAQQAQWYMMRSYDFKWEYDRMHLSPEMYAKLRELNEAYVPGDGPPAVFIPVNRRRV